MRTVIQRVEEIKEESVILSRGSERFILRIFPANSLLKKIELFLRQNQLFSRELK